jgi:hypothetical protein
MALNDQEIVKFIFQSLENLNEERDDSEKIVVSEETRLFGSKSVLDSLALVFVIADIETSLSEELGETISLMDDRALSQERSPFYSVRSLADYIGMLVAEKK